ncbi:DUF2213 domain-containing protein [Kosakonia sacchari]|uniref:DUF2213 domain-containing protein n=1 Tax=Kosakonia sacchari TaxID=1158459 RepID=UPI001584760C|nr:DUF2213 domain-containing protein [Kosakonia sacchari]NUL35053.1 DUF2213 domain-containing protein [Kosakonia sacchari]
MLQESPINTDAIKKWDITPEGYLQIDIPIARPGVLTYDQKRGDAFTSKEYRSEKELFNPDSMNTLIGKTVTVSRHPSEKINARNYKAVHAGVVIAAFRDGNDLVARVEIRDGDSIKLIQRDKRLRGASAGYGVRNKIKQVGVSPDGVNYDTVDEGLEYDHVSIVRNPRVKTAVFNLDGEPMELEEALEKITTLEAEKATLTADLSTVRGDLLKANSKLINMDSMSNARYEQGLADGRSEHELRETAKRMKINVDALKDTKLIKQAVIQKANPDMNTDEISGMSDGEINVALRMALASPAAKQFEQRQPTFQRREPINNDEQGEESAHQQYMNNSFNGAKNANNAQK